MANLSEEVRILSITPATKSGWAVYRDGRIIAHGVERFRAGKEMASRYCKWLVGMLEKYGITHVVAEEAFMGGAGMCVPLERMKNFLERVCREFHKRWHFIRGGVMPSNGKAAIVGIVKYFGYELESDEADGEANAIGVMLTYLEICGFPVTHPNE